ncbi:MAG: hypothetical protein CMH83_00765 [Nocardioides sp.]|nr:hypothetical protein [Nocardioides sp.]
MTGLAGDPASSTRLAGQQALPASVTPEQSHTWVRALFEHSPMSVFAVDTRGRFIASNAPSQLQSGYSEAELTAMTFIDLLHPDDLERVAQQFARLLAGEAQQTIVRFRHADGSDVELDVLGLPVAGADGGVAGALVVSQDLTAKRRAEEEMRRAHAAALRAAEVKAGFLATISHEIRTPLTSLLAGAELLGESELDDDQRRLLALMDRSGARLLRLVDDLLDFTRLEGGRATLADDPFDLREVVEEAVGLARDWAAAKDLTLDAAVTDDVPPVVVGDGTRICQVLVNLLSNAVKFTDEGGVRVTVDVARELRPAGRRVVVSLTVTDTGIGMSDEEQTGIFEVFTQVRPSARGGGTGLGLAVCRELVQVMGGRIEVRSDVGAGSVFTCLLPLGVSTLAEVPTD